jgi:hypothetical protein
VQSSGRTPTAAKAEIGTVNVYSWPFTGIVTFSLPFLISSDTEVGGTKICDVISNGVNAKPVNAQNAAMLAVGAVPLDATCVTINLPAATVGFTVVAPLTETDVTPPAPLNAASGDAVNSTARARWSTKWNAPVPVTGAIGALVMLSNGPITVPRAVTAHATPAISRFTVNSIPHDVPAATLGASYTSSSLCGVEALSSVDERTIFPPTDPGGGVPTKTAPTLCTV